MGCRLIYGSLFEQEVSCEIIPEKEGNALGKIDQSCQANLEAGYFGESKLCFSFSGLKM